jgi:hypothetical protein
MRFHFRDTLLAVKNLAALRPAPDGIVRQRRVEQALNPGFMTRLLHAAMNLRHIIQRLNSLRAASQAGYDAC